MARIGPTTEELAQLASVHLYYEVAMLRGANAEHKQRRRDRPDMMELDRADPTRIGCMAFFESALLHARVLNDFLTLPPEGHREDDVWAGDYIKNWKPPTPGPLKRTVSVAKGRGVKEMINKQLAHLSLKRLHQTPFYVSEITRAVVEDMTRFANDTNNVCYAELEGVRNLLTRNPWPTA